MSNSLDLFIGLIENVPKPHLRRCVKVPEPINKLSKNFVELFVRRFVKDLRPINKVRPCFKHPRSIDNVHEIVAYLFGRLCVNYPKTIYWGKKQDL